MTRTHRVLVATRSSHKLDEIRQILEDMPVRFISLDDARIEYAPEEKDLEPYATFAENALSKARYFHALSDLPTIADDSGLCVDALDGAPGVRTRRFAPGELAARLGRGPANNRHLLERLADVPAGKRGAHYECAIAALSSETEPQVVEGRVDGEISAVPAGDGGFGYDPLFLLPDHGRTYAELPSAVKRETSHRALALRQLRPWLSTFATSD